MASVTAFQAVNAGSIPVTRSQLRKVLVKDKNMVGQGSRRTDDGKDKGGRTREARGSSVRNVRREQKNEKHSGQDTRGSRRGK